MQDTGRDTMLKIWRRIVPLMLAALFFNYLDKVNIGFAAVTMNRDLGISNTVFGAAAGFSALGYALFGFPSTLILHRQPTNPNTPFNDSSGGQACDVRRGV